MPVVDVLEAKDTLSRLVALDAAASGPRLGVARGRFDVPEAIDADDAEIAGMFDAGTGSRAVHVPLAVLASLRSASERVAESTHPLE